MVNPANNDQAYAAAEAVALRSRGKLIAYLAARFGDVAAAEDALSEAFASALSVWPEKGCPENPEGWLLTAARRKLIDHIRRNRETSSDDEPEQLADAMIAAADDEFPDRRLALLFACAHPAIDPAIRAPLMLQVVLGLEATQIASAFLGFASCHGAAAGASQDEDPRGRHPLPHPGTQRTPRPPGIGAGFDLRGLCRRMGGRHRNRSGPPGTGRGGDLSRQAADTASSGRAGSLGLAGADALRRGAQTGAPYGRGRVCSPEEPGQDAVGLGHDRRS